MRVDTRAGSKDLIEPLRAAGVTVEEAVLPAGDIEIVGCGPGDRPRLIGIEYKSIEDVAACVRNGRFAEQLRRMRESYEVSWLLIEGRWRGLGKDGLYVRRHEKWFQIPSRVSYQEVSAWTFTMAQCGGTLLWRTESQAESVAWLRTLELWWTAKSLEEHRAHLDWYTPPTPVNPFGGEPSLTQKWAIELPGIGAGKAKVVADHFASAKEMACAEPSEWLKLKGVGKKMAAAIVKAIGEKKR